jgi:hypothetical protein
VPLQCELLIPQLLRILSNISRFFPPVDLGTGPIRDGALTHNCPLELAVCEQAHAWPDMHTTDIVLSLGTGSTLTREPYAPAREPILARHKEESWVLKCFPSLRCIANLASTAVTSIDSERVYQKFMNSRTKDEAQAYFRQNIRIKEIPDIDDISTMDELRVQVQTQPLGNIKRLEIITALLASSFYFELDRLPIYDNQYYRCEGSIRCRNNGLGAVRALVRLIPSFALEFTFDMGTLATVNEGDVCSWCQRFSKSVVFYVRHPSQTIAISLRTSDLSYHNLSSFPKPVEWFVTQQRLEARFGVADHHAPGSFFCHKCDENRLEGRKRQVPNPCFPPGKRLRIR